MRHFFARHGLYLAWLIALITTLVSLYFQVIQNMLVCDLCWYQRICLYPLVLILGIACYREDRGIVIYAMPLALIGCLFALYQYLEQMIPGFSPMNLCGPDNNCAQIDFIWLGFLTIPLLSMIVNVLIIWLLWLTKRPFKN